MVRYARRRSCVESPSYDRFRGLTAVAFMRPHYIIPTGARPQKPCAQVKKFRAAETMSQSNAVSLHRWDELALEKVTEMISRKIVTGDREMLAQIYLKK